MYKNPPKRDLPVNMDRLPSPLSVPVIFRLPARIYFVNSSRYAQDGELQKHMAPSMQQGLFN